MSKHFKNLNMILPNLASSKILDIGSGKGRFLIEAAKHGATCEGLEKNQEYIDISLQAAQEAGVTINVRQGLAEAMDFDNEAFDFINLAEVIEHVESPEKTIAEFHRVLKKGGKVYISAPSRYSIKDTHFHLYFVNWLPRSMSDWYIGLFKAHKNYDDKSAGHQRLSDMHYYTYSGGKRLFEKFGFKVEDLRVLKIKHKFSGPLQLLVLSIYKILRPFYFRAFHYLLTKR